MVSIKPLNPWNFFSESIDVVLITRRRTLMHKLVHLLKRKLWRKFFATFSCEFCLCSWRSTFKRKFTAAISWAPAEKTEEKTIQKIKFSVFVSTCWKKNWKNNSENIFQFLWAPAEPLVHSSLSSVAQFWQAALVGRERLLGGDVGHLLLLAVHHLLQRSAACARQTQVELYFQPSPPVQELLLCWVRMGKGERKRERNHYQRQRHRMF